VDNVYGVYRPDRGEEMPITSKWSDEDNCYVVSVVGADIDLLVYNADSEEEAFDIVAEEELGRELTHYAFAH